MAFDGIVTRAMVREINEKIYMGKIEKVYQPEADELVFNIHTKSGNCKLFASAGSAHHLCYQRKCAFARAEIIHEKRIVRRYHADERHVGKIMPFCDHLRADENIRLAVFEFFADFILRKSAARGIRIHAHYARFRKKRRQLVLYFLRAETAEGNMLAAA